MDKQIRKTKIVATVGPSSSKQEQIAKLVEAGVDIFRLNFSHGSNQEKGAIIDIIRSVAEKKKKAVGILADLQGPKIRTGRMENGAIPLRKGDSIAITTDEVKGTPALISTIYKALPRDVKPGSRILLDDGLIEFKVQSIKGNVVNCVVVEGGTLKDLKGINLPGVNVSSPSLTEKDRIDLEFALSKRVDYVALSFVRRAEDILDIKQVIYEHGLTTPVVAKIEKPEAIRNFDEILEATDAVMVARGDLGVEINAEKVPLLQKKIIRACNEAGKPVITATQMLESMILHPRPTRAETSDVANAIIDGTDAVMLSGETASGAHPLEAVKTMAKIALDVEKSHVTREDGHGERKHVSIAEAVAESACHAAAAVNARAVVVFTQSGGTAALIAKNRPRLPIVAFAPSEEIRRRLSIYRGVRTLPAGAMDNTDQQIALVEETLLATGYCKSGDVVVITMGVPLGSHGTTNLMKVHTLG